MKIKKLIEKDSLLGYLIMLIAIIEAIVFVKCTT